MTDPNEEALAGVRILEEAATEHYEALNTQTNEPVRFGTVRHAKMMKIRREMNKEGRRLLKPFVEWMILLHGKSPQHAEIIAGLAWTATWETARRPVLKLHRTDLSWQYRLQLRGALSLFGSWLLTRDEADPEEQVWARQLINDIARVAKSNRKPLRERKDLVRAPKADPMPEEDVQLLLTTLETRQLTARSPWARSVVGFVIKTGAAVSSTVVHIEREQVVKALAQQADDGAGVLPVWSSATLSRHIPVSLVKEELETWVHWPIPWGIVADFVRPRTKLNQAARAARAAETIGRQLKFAVRESGLEYDRHQMMTRIRYAAVVRLWRQTHDLLAIQSMFGYPINRAKMLLRIWGEWEAESD